MPSGESQSDLLLPAAVYGAIAAVAILTFALAYRVGTAIEAAFQVPPATHYARLPVVTKADTAVAVSALGNPGQFFSADSYPVEALRRNEQGRTVAHLTISPTGAVSACAIRTSSGSAALDEATCRIALTRMRMQPARDAAGNAIASSFTLPVRWVLPQRVDVPQPSRPRPRDLPVAPALIALIEAFVVGRALATGAFKGSRRGEPVTRAAKPTQYWASVGVHALIAGGALFAILARFAIV